MIIVPAFVDAADILVLLVAFAAYIPMIMLYRRHRPTWLFLSYTAMVGAIVSTTIIEDLLPDLFAVLLEDGMIALFAVLFFLSAYYSRLEIYRMEEDKDEVLL